MIMRCCYYYKALYSDKAETSLKIKAVSFSLFLYAPGNLATAFQVFFFIILDSTGPAIELNRLDQNEDASCDLVRRLDIYARTTAAAFALPERLRRVL